MEGTAEVSVVCRMCETPNQIAASEGLADEVEMSCCHCGSALGRWSDLKPNAAYAPPVLVHSNQPKEAA
jgi:hypothetical protein